MASEALFLVLGRHLSVRVTGYFELVELLHYYPWNKGTNLVFKRVRGQVLDVVQIFHQDVGINDYKCPGLP